MFFFINGVIKINMQEKSKIKISSNRSFGIVFFIVFLIVAIWPLMHGDQIRSWSAVISLIFLILGVLNSKLLHPLNLLWFKLGILLGSIVAPIAMGIVFFLVITPIGIFMKMLGKDLLQKKYDVKKKTYWMKREKSIGTMKRQF